MATSAPINVTGTLAFPYLYMPAKDTNEKTGEVRERYRAVLLIEENSDQHKRIQAHLESFYKSQDVNSNEDFYDDELGCLVDPQKLALRVPTLDQKKKYGWKGKVLLSASEGIQPGLWDENNNELLPSDNNKGDNGKLQSTDEVTFRVTFWSQNNTHGKRINANLLGVKHRSNGSRDVGGASARPEASSMDD